MTDPQMRNLAEAVKIRIIEPATANVDNALLADTNNPGGINLNPAYMNLQIKRDKNGVALPVNMQPIDNIKIDGFAPVIINITPIYNLPLLLGIKDIPGGKKTTQDKAKPDSSDLSAYLKDENNPNLVLSRQ